MASGVDEAKVGDEIGRDSFVIPIHPSITEADTKNVGGHIYPKSRGIQILLSLQARIMVRFDFCLHRNASPEHGSQEECGGEYHSEAENVYCIGKMTNARELHGVAKTSSLITSSMRSQNLDPLLETTINRNIVAGYLESRVSNLTLSRTISCHPGTTPALSSTSFAPFEHCPSDTVRWHSCKHLLVSNMPSAEQANAIDLLFAFCLRQSFPAA